MGNVNYPVSISSLPSYELREFLEGFNSYYIYVNVPIGTVKPSASRESLDMNTKTTNAVMDAFNKVKSEIQSEFAKKIESSKSMWEAFQTYHNLYNTLGFKGLKASYQGNPIAQVAISPRTGTLKAYNKSTFGTRNCWKRESNIVPRQNTIIFYHDNSIAQNSVYNRVIQYLDSINDELRNQLYILSFGNSAMMDSWLDDNRFDGANKVNLADVTYVNPKKRVVNKVVKSTAYRYTGQGCRNYAKWQNITIDLNGEGFYLPVKRNLCEDITFTSLDNLISEMRRISPHVDIIGVRYDEVENLGSGWVNYLDYCQQTGIDYITKNDLQDSVNKYFAYSGANSNWYEIKRKHIDFGVIDIDTFLSNYTLTPYSVSILLRIQSYISKPIITLTDSKYIDEFNFIKDKYDLIPAFDMSVHSLLTNEMLIKYVNMVN
ncbi:MAG: hypothetical protein EBU66_20370 [Bacteroidetes bacterium]|nr:hypothetical protein [Bacteroidota bacterium]